MAFLYKRAVTFDHTKVTGTPTGIPVLVQLDASNCGTTLKTTAGGGHVESASGYDIWFYSDAALTTRIPAEREKYDGAAGTWLGWVKVTLSSVVDSVIYVAYGDAAIVVDPNSDGTYGKTAVWDANYKAVWHLGDGAALSLLDSTSNAKTLTNHGATAIAGKVHGGAACTGGQYLDEGTLSLTAGQSVTVEYWHYIPAAVGAGVFGIGGQNNPDRCSADPWLDGNLYFDYGDSGGGGRVSAAYATGAWQHIVALFDSATNLHRLYINGVPTSSTNANKPTIGLTGAFLGTDGLGLGFEGRLDEFRISGISRADWATTQYQNQNAPLTFHTIGAEIVYGAPRAAIIVVPRTVRSPLATVSNRATIVDRDTG